MPYISVEGCRLYYTVQGQGMPIVCIHPPVLTHTNFTYQMEELSQFFTVISFDIRGHGRSSFSRQALTYPLIAEDIKNILDHLNIEKAYICGYSTGGSIALEFLLSHSERALGGIVLSGMSEVHDSRLRNKISLGATFARTKAVPALALSISWTNSDTIGLLGDMFAEAQKGKAKNIEQYYKYSLLYNVTNQLGKIEQPVLLLYGKKDKGFSSYAKQLHDKLPVSELHFIENVSHQIPTKAASEVNHFIREFIQAKEQQAEEPYHMVPNFMLEQANVSEYGENEIRG